MAHHRPGRQPPLRRAVGPQRQAGADHLAGADGLGAGSQLTADQFRNVNNSVRAGQGARGVSYGPASQYAEVMANSQYGDNLYNQRQAQASSTAELGNRLYSLPTLQAFGMASGAGTGQAQSFLGQGGGVAGGAGPSLFSPQDSSSLFSTIYNAQAAQNIASKNNQGALLGAGIGAAGSLGGAAIMAGAI